MVLKEMRNDIEVVGRLKSHTLKEVVTAKGNEAVMGRVVIEVIDGDNINNIQLSSYAGKINRKGEVSKLFKSLLTVATEYKTIDVDGYDEADMVSVTGNITINDYKRDDVLVTTNQNRSLFFNRLTDKNVEQHAIAKVDVVVENFIDELDAEGIPTGNFKVKGMTAGYGSKIIPLKNMIIKEKTSKGADLAQTFKDLYIDGSTGTLTLKLNNHPDKTSKDEFATLEQVGFGEEVELESELYGNFINNIEIIGGTLPFSSEFEVSAEDILEMKKLRETQKAVAENATPKPKPDMAQREGFGEAAKQMNELPSAGNSSIPKF